MSGVNKAILVGNLGKDPEMKFTANGSAVTSFSLATSRNVGSADDKNGRREETDWHNIVCWNKLAELANQYLQTSLRNADTRGEAAGRESALLDLLAAAVSAQVSDDDEDTVLVRFPIERTEFLRLQAQLPAEPEQPPAPQDELARLEEESAAI